MSSSGNASDAAMKLFLAESFSKDSPHYEENVFQVRVKFKANSSFFFVYLLPRTKIPATVSCGILQERCGKVTVSRRKAPEVEAVFRPELFFDEFLRVPCAFLWETVGNHRKKFRESFGRNTASIFQCVSGVFQWNVPEMRRVSPVPAIRLCPGSVQRLSMKFWKFSIEFLHHFLNQIQNHRQCYTNVINEQ
jgi:hypothetical protein